MARYVFNLPTVQATQTVRLDTALGSDSPASGLLAVDGTAIGSTLTADHIGFLPEVQGPDGVSTLYVKVLAYGGAVTGTPVAVTGLSQQAAPSSPGGSSPVDYATFVFGVLGNNFTLTSGAWHGIPLTVDPASSNDSTTVTTSPDGATSITAPVDGIYALTADAYIASDPAAASSLLLSAVIGLNGSGCSVTNGVPIDTGMNLSPSIAVGTGNTFFCPAGGVICVRARQDTGGDLDIGGNASLVLLASATPPTP